MKRREFIDTLTTLLKNEMPDDKVQEQVSYYNDYINQQGDERAQEEEIERIGPPYLIAQTIIESYKMSDQFKYHSYGKTDSFEEEKVERNFNDDGENTHISIWSKIKRFCITAGVVIVLLALFRFAFAIFVRIGLPLIVVYLIVRLIKRNV